MAKAIIDDYEAIRAAMQKEPDQPLCEACEGGGWVETFSHNPPAFKECDRCYNPDNLGSYVLYKPLATGIVNLHTTQEDMIMADEAVVHIGENSPEKVAYMLMVDVLNADGIERTGDNILATYLRCIRTVRGLPAERPTR